MKPKYQNKGKREIQNKYSESPQCIYIYVYMYIMHIYITQYKLMHTNIKRFVNQFYEEFGSKHKWEYKYKI